MSRLRALKWTSHVCLVVGFAIPCVASGYIGMSLYKRPGISIANAVLWVAGLLAAYLAHVGEKKYLATAPAWMRISGFLTSTPATIVFLGLLWGYVYYPTMEKSVIARWAAVPLMLSLFAGGIQITKDHWTRVFKQPKAVGLVVLLRWVAPPLIAYILGHAILVRFLPQPAGNLLAIGMIVLATTGSASNTMTLISRGDLALSVTVAAVNNIIAPFVQPFLITFLAVSFVGHTDTLAIFVELAEIVLAPIILGSIVGGIFPQQVKRINPCLGAIAVLCLSAVMLANISKGTSTLRKQLWILPWMIGACAVQAMAVLLVGYHVSKYFGFTMKQRVSATFDVAVENAALATIIAMNHLGPLAALPSIFYGKFQHMFGIGLFVRKFQNMQELAEEEQPAVRVAVKEATAMD